MTDSQENTCRDCGKPLGSGLFAKETRVMGMAYCEPCVRARTLFCHTCRAALKPEDFETGKAVTLLGRRFCENCLESAVQAGRERAGTSSSTHKAARPDLEETQDVDTIAIRRLYGRYVPHAEASLVVKAEGLLGSLRGNLVRLWLDVSEGGFRAVIAGSYSMDDGLRGALRQGGQVFPFRALVKHVRPSKRYPGCVLVGAKFDKPSKELQAFILNKMGGRPVMIPAPPQAAPKPRPRPASTKFPPPSPAHV